MSSIVAGPPEVVDIYYPEGPPMPEGNLQTKRRMELVAALRHWYARRNIEGAWVCCDINVYYREGDPKAVVAPDVAVAFGVDAAVQDPENTYRVWEVGAVPCFVLEIASPNTVRTDLYVKPAKYAELGVEEYWRLDPTGGDLLDPPLQGDRRQHGRWAPIEVVPDGDGLRGRSETLGLDLCWQPPKLRLWDIANSAWLPDDLSEEVARADAAEARAAAQAARADQQAARADQQAARADQQTAARQAAEQAARAAQVRADEQAAARQAAEAELAELRARLDRP